MTMCNRGGGRSTYRTLKAGRLLSEQDMCVLTCGQTFEATSTFGDV